MENRFGVPGTETSTERRVQRLYQVFEPLEGSRPDWKIIQDIANRLGAGWEYLHPSHIMDGVVAGIRDYGNHSGVPTVSGAVLFDERYATNPLVFCVCGPGMTSEEIAR